MNNLGQALEAIGPARRRPSTRSARPSRSTSDQLSRTATWPMRSRQRAALREAAAALRTRGRRSRPADAAIRYDYGSLLDRSGRVRRRRPANCAKPIRLKPDYAEAHNNLGIALASQGRLPEAIAHWEEAMRLRPDFADARAESAEGEGGKAVVRRFEVRRGSARLARTPNRRNRWNPRNLDLAHQRV